MFFGGLGRFWGVVGCFGADGIPMICVMGALRKTAPQPLEPTEIILFPIDRAWQESREAPSWLEKFADSEFGNVVLFELKAFAFLAVAGFVFLGLLLGGYWAKEAAGVDVLPDGGMTPLVGVVVSDPLAGSSGGLY